MGKFLILLGRLLTFGAIFSGLALAVTAPILVSENELKPSEINTFLLWFFTSLTTGSILSYLGSAAQDYINGHDLNLDYWVILISSIIFRLSFIMVLAFLADPIIQSIINR